MTSTGTEDARLLGPKPTDVKPMAAAKIFPDEPEQSLATQLAETANQGPTPLVVASPGPRSPLGIAMLLNRTVAN